MSGSTGVTCNRCQASGLGWCVSRSTRKHYLAWLVPTPTVAADGVTIVQQLRPQPNLLHRCGETIEQAREQAAQYAAERARVRALGQAPQPIAPVAPTAAAKLARKTSKPVKSTAAVGAVSVTAKTGEPIPFATANGAVNPIHLSTADQPGKLEAAVVMTNALVTKGYPREIAAAIVAAGKPDQIAALLLK